MTLVTPSANVPGPVTGSVSPYSFDLTKHDVSMNNGTASDANSSNYWAPGLFLSSGEGYERPTQSTAEPATLRISAPSLSGTSISDLYRVSRNV